ncbi:hypothetical protein [Streptomyces sp. NPDC004376]
MKLREAKEEIERDRPYLTGTAKIEAIKALMDAAPAEHRQHLKPLERASEPQPYPTGAGILWAWLILGTGGLLLLCWLVWGSATQAPWGVKTLIVGQVVATFAGLCNAYAKDRHEPV